MAARMFRLSDTEQSLILASPIFSGLSADHLQNVLCCLEADVRTYEKHSVLFYPDEPLSRIFLLIGGSVQLCSYDGSGNKNILGKFTPGESFGETAVSMSNTLPQFQAETLADSRTLELNIRRIFSQDTCRCPHRVKVMENLIQLLTSQNRRLVLKTELLSRKTPRGKLQLYFDHLSREQHSKTISLSMNRTELADYLSVNRSALSREISRMQEECLIEVRKNKVNLLAEAFPDSV